MAATSAMTLSGLVVAAAPANRLSSSVAFGSSRVQKLAAARPAAKALCKIGEAKASLNDEEQSVAAKPQMLMAIVAAGAALALNAAAPVSPAVAGLFGGDTKVERSSSGFLGNEGTGTKVGSNSAVRGSSGTPFGEGTGKKVGENADSRGSASTGSPFGEGSKSGSSVNVSKLSAPDVGGAAEKAKGAVQGAAPSADPLKSIGNLNPFQSSGGTPDVAGEAKKSVGGLFGGTPNVERGSSSDFPGKEATGTKVGNNSDLRGLAGTPFGEGAGNVVGDNSATREAASTGTPLGEGNQSGSGVNVGEVLQGAPDVGGAVEKAKSTLQGAVPSVDPLKSTIGGTNPFKSGTSDVGSAAADAKKSAMGVVGDVKSKLPGGN